MSKDKLTLYNSEGCPFGHRVTTMLTECGASYEYITIDIQNKPSWYKDVNPDGKIPTLMAKNEYIPESLVIMEYLCERFPEKNLMPKDLLRRAKVRFAIEYYFSRIGTMLYKCITNFQDETIRKEYMTSTNDYLLRFNDILLQESATGPYFLGDQFSLADIAIAPFALRMNGFNRLCLKEFEFEAVKSCPRLTQFFDGLATRPSIQENYYGDEAYFELLDGLFHFFQ
ncbi:MAG: thioredoxin-like protein [Benjaminiella poitrasii]|nr:MAG: thioredoxin-like protein [Benjaminiella poitrasii]